jgi:hypothetical protein
MTKEERKEYNKQWYQKNKERIKQFRQYHKEIRKKSQKEYYEKNKKRILNQKKQYGKNNKERIKKYKKQYCEKNKEKISQNKKQYYQNHKEEKKQYGKIYKQNNKEKIYKYRNKKHREDINFKLSCNLRNRINCAIKHDQKRGSAVKDLGCSIEFLKKHLEKQFKEGMSWDNWGLGDNKWHIDHIIPLSSFDLTDREQFLKACHYTNLQPLWAEENMKKGKKIIY